MPFGGASPQAAVDKLAANDPTFTECILDKNAILQMKTAEYLPKLAKALKTNTVCRKLSLVDCNICDSTCGALAASLQTNTGLVSVNLQENKVGNDGAIRIANSLAHNRSLLELNLMSQKGTSFGDATLVAFTGLLDTNVTLLKISWRRESRQSLCLTKMLTRNNDIDRRIKAGKDYADLIPAKANAPTATEFVAPPAATFDPPPEPTHPPAEHHATLDANMRVALSDFLPGDVVRTVRGSSRLPSGIEGTIDSISAGHMASVLVGSTVEKVQLRDCKIIQPLGRRRVTKATTRHLVLGRWSGEYHVSYNGDFRRPSGDRQGRPTKNNGSWMLTVGESQPVPAGGRVVSVTLKVDTLTDQGWGGTGNNGLRLSCSRRTNASEPLEGEDGLVSDTLLDVTYNRAQHGKARNETLRLPNDAFRPRAGDTLQVSLFSVVWGGWSATCANVTVEAEVEFLEDLEQGAKLAEDWQTEQLSAAALECAWSAFKGNVDACLYVQELHLRAAGETGSVAPSDGAITCLPKRRDSLGTSASLLPRFDSLLEIVKALEGGLPSQAKCAKARGLLEKLVSNATVMGAPADEALRRKRYARLIEVAGVTLRALHDAEETQRQQQLEVVVEHYGEAVDHCIFRWDREIHNMHSYVTGEASGTDAEEIEDAVLGMLQAWRRVIAGDLLHKVKTKEVSEGRADQAADTHFEAAFYGRMSFGLPETTYSRYDPNRLTYGRYALSSLPSAEVLQAQLLSSYTPSAMIARLGKDLIEPQTAAAQLRREKLTDWFKSHLPAGVPSHGGTEAEVRDTWLYSYVHDEETYELTNAAIAYLLCVMGVLRMESKVVLPGGGPRSWSYALE